jgi:hypothetical protein
MALKGGDGFITRSSHLLRVRLVTPARPLQADMCSEGVGFVTGWVPGVTGSSLIS